LSHQALGQFTLMEPGGQFADRMFEESEWKPDWDCCYTRAGQFEARERKHARDYFPNEDPIG